MGYGGFCWFQLLTTDVKAATEFYGVLLGWSFTRQPDIPGNTSFIENAGEGIGDVSKLDPSGNNSSPLWRAIVSVDDVDAAVARAETLGGRIISGPFDIPGGFGRVADIADPSGATLSVYTSASGEAAPTVHRPDVPGFGGWFELYCRDVEEATAFYGAMFGWQKQEDMDMGGAGIYRLFTVNGVQTGGMMKPMEPGTGPTWNFYFNCKSVEAAAASIRGAGGDVLMGPHEVPGGSWIIMARDPQGIMFSLVSPGK